MKTDSAPSIIGRIEWLNFGEHLADDSASSTWRQDSPSLLISHCNVENRDSMFCRKRKPRGGGNLTANRARRSLIALSMLTFGCLCCFSQKVKVGHDKSADFSKFKTYNWTDPAMPATRPVVFEAVVARTDVELQAKGLTRVSTEGDLALTPAGGIDFGFAGVASTPILPTYSGPAPSINGGMWTGATGPSAAGSYVSEGTLVLTFVDRANNKIVWSGTVKQKLDIEQKNKSLDLIDKAVIKLLKQFPGN